MPTPSQRDALAARGFRNLRVWGRGVDTSLFRPDNPATLQGPRPVLMYMGRVAVEKNIEAFLDLNLPGAKVIIGDGPDRERLSQVYPDCHFLGYKFGRELARHIAGADVFVFPSKTDTFGIVLLEAMACGLPVAAYPVPGPRDVVDDGVSGVLDEDLEVIVTESQRLTRLVNNVLDFGRLEQGRKRYTQANLDLAELVPPERS